MMRTKTIQTLILSTIILLPASSFAGIVTYQLGQAGGHVLWLPGITTGGASDDWLLASGGLFVWDQTAKTATMSGTVENHSNSALKLDFDFDFTQLSPSEVASQGVEPKKELSSSVYGTASGQIDTNTWTYFNFTGTLTGSGGGLTGAFDITQLPTSGKHPFQLGYGANGKNLEFGGSAWFTWTEQSGTTLSGLQSTASGKHGDTNLVLTQVPAPAPGTLSLVLVGLGLAAARRRRRA